MHATMNEVALNIEQNQVSPGEPASRSDQTKRFHRLAQHDYTFDQPQIGDDEQSSDTRFFSGVGTQNFAVIEDRTNQNQGFQLFFREIVSGQETGELINLGTAIQFAGAMLSQATRYDLLQKTSLSYLEDNRVVPHHIVVKFGEYTFQFTDVDGINATKWYEATFLKIMQTIFDDIFAETVDLRSNWTVFISTVRRTLTGDDTVPHPYLGKRPNSFDRAVSLLNLIDSIAFGKTLFINQSAIPSDVASPAIFDIAESPVEATKIHISLPEQSDKPHKLKTEKFSPETISKHTTLIEKLVIHELNLATSSWLTKRFHQMRVSKSQKLLENFKASNDLSISQSYEMKPNSFEAATKLHILCRELSRRYSKWRELSDRFDRYDSWSRNVSNLLADYERAVAWQLLDRSAHSQFTEILASITSLFEAAAIECKRGYELDTIIIYILNNCMPDGVKNDASAEDQLAFNVTTLLCTLISNLKEKFAEEEEITGNEKNVVELIIILSKIFCYTDDSYELADNEFLVKRDLHLLKANPQIVQYIHAFAKEPNTSYTGKRSELGVYIPKSRIMPTISSISEVES